MSNFILASASPRRQELLQRIIPHFTIEPAGLDESAANSLPARERPNYLAREKALLISKKHPNAVVLGCDTGVILGGEMLGKPKNPAQAAEMLRRLSGRTHEVITGCCLAQNGLLWAMRAVTKVTFYPLSEACIASYIATDEPYDKAGGYGIQSAGGLFVRRIVGDYYNVVGLPLSSLARLLRRAQRQGRPPICKAI